MFKISRKVLCFFFLWPKCKNVKFTVPWAKYNKSTLTPEKLEHKSSDFASLKGSKQVWKQYPCLHVICHFLTIVIDSSSITVKETLKQRKEAKLIKQLEKQKEQEAAEKEKLAQRQNKKGNVTLDSHPVQYTCE